MLRSTATGTLASLTSVLFPTDCRVCSTPLSGFSLLPVCSSCWNDLPAQAGPLCARCGEALDLDPSAEMLCRSCRTTPPPFEKATAHGAYAGTLRTLLHLLKYDRMQPVARRLGILLAGQLLLTANLPAELIVVPVPLFRGKRRQRGFNQTALLAHAAVKALRQRRAAMRLTLAPGVLERRRATDSQAGLSPHQRRVNVRGAFFVSRPELVNGRHILLIDDIYTTGATARACSLALRRAGAASVRVATVARAQREFPSRLSGFGEAVRAVIDAPELPMEEDFALWEEGRTVETVGGSS